jgi:hypothetical protein
VPVGGIMLCATTSGGLAAGVSGSGAPCPEAIEVIARMRTVIGNFVI